MVGLAFRQQPAVSANGRSVTLDAPSLWTPRGSPFVPRNAAEKIDDRQGRSNVGSLVYLSGWKAKEVMAMRAVFALSSTLVAAVLLTATEPAQAQNARWCLRGADSGILECAYYTLAQCKATRSGETSGTCVRNPRLAQPT